MMKIEKRVDGKSQIKSPRALGFTVGWVKIQTKKGSLSKTQGLWIDTFEAFMFPWLWNKPVKSIST